MTLIVLASNVLVQFPLSGKVGTLALGDILTWGAFTYPFAFLVTDLTNRRYGPVVARRVVYAGFAVAILTSIVVPPILFDAGLLGYPTAGERLVRIACASGAAFLMAQLFDIAVFNRLRRSSWWRAPAFASLTGSVVDTLTFFTLAFAPFFLLLGPGDEFSLANAPLLGVMTAEAPRWISWALGDFVVKVLIAVFALVPYRILMQRVVPYRPVGTAV
ncbi:membrane protein [Aureimonas sp. SA4125]|nr:membrane protein [Aureimonas sp. SA4125]